EYHLGPGANNFGYDITSIQSIAAWPGAGRGNQAYTVEVKLKGAASYTPGAGQIFPKLEIFLCLRYFFVAAIYVNAYILLA
ncbi:MAG: hypothetical protein NTZ16_00870, partial [Verrucomicrobia bacterium]|nr:hypothetical protein [Verrucomicrobiota bacterium]